MVRDAAAAFQPHAWVNVHSGMEALFLPYDHVAHIPEGPDAAASLALLQQLNITTCGGRCAVGSGGKSVGCAGHVRGFYLERRVLLGVARSGRCWRIRRYKSAAQ